MSGAQTSGFPDQNQLMSANAQQLANYYAPERNRLFVQQATQEAAGREMEAMSRASQGLLSLPDEATRAAEYPKTVQYLQSLGFAKNAPATYPGEQTLQMIRARGLPVEQQFNLGLTGPSPVIGQIADIYRNATKPSGPGAPAESPVLSGDTQARAKAVHDGMVQRGWSDNAAWGFAANAVQESGARPDAAVGDGGRSHGVFQWNGDRLAAFQAKYGVLPGAATLDQQLDFANDELGGSEKGSADAIRNAQTPGQAAAVISGGYLRPADVAGEQVRRAGIASRLTQGLDSGGVPAAPRGVAARTGGTNFAGPGVPTAPAAPAVPTAPAPPAPAAAGGTTAEQPANQPLINRLSSIGGAQPPAAPAPAVPAAPVVPAAPDVPPPAPTTPTPAPAATATQALPHATEVPTGLASQNFQQARALEAQAAKIEMLASQAGPKDLRTQQFAAKAAADLRAQAAELKSTDTFVQTQEGQLNARTNQLFNPAAPNAHYVWDEQKGAYIDTTNTHPPVTPPSPRNTYVPGTGLVQSKPGGGAIIVAPMNPQGLTTQKGAEAAGTAAGTATGKLTTQLAEQGRNAGQAIGNIDYGLSQLQKASSAGIPTGYFSSALAGAAAMAKSLGIDTTALGVDPEAVGNIQSAQKTLAVVAGAILQQAIGKGSAITDAKIEHFIHAQPDIQTDPQAVNRVLNWARSQFVYEREMAAAGMKDASETGVLPTNWLAKYYADHGFAPIYNPETGHMEQPDSRAPGREAPPPPDKRPPLTSFQR